MIIHTIPKVIDAESPIIIFWTICVHPFNPLHVQTVRV